MNQQFLMKVYFISFLLFVFFIMGFYANAQTCSGSLGDPIINFNFGSGANPGSPLSATNLTYTPNDCPVDGSYTVRTNTSNCFGNTWHSVTSDHTGNANGYFMLINASVQPSTFYIDTVRGLCPNTTYEFGAWIMNVILPTACNGNANQPNITFSIEKTDGTVLQTNITGNIPSTASPIWVQKAFLFTTTSAVSDIVLRMVNNAPGGCGNDLALDDITFRPCGPSLTPTITNTASQNTDFCQGEIKFYTFSCTVSSGYINPVYQWQKSFNGNNFTDILGANTTTLQAQYGVNSVVGNYRYRLQVAEAGNFASAQCRVSSDPLTIIIKSLPVATISSNSPICENATLLLNSSGGINYDWQGPANFTSTSNQPAIQNAQIQNAGMYKVKVTDANNCYVIDSINFVVNPSPVAAVSFATDTVCLGSTVLLEASGGLNYEWFPVTFLSTPQQQNTKASPLNSIVYNVKVTNSFGCIDSASVDVKVIKVPVVNAGADVISVAGKTVQLLGSISGDFAGFTWSPTDFMLNETTLTPVVNPPTDFQYILTAVAPKNCGSSTDTVQVKIIKGVFIPNAFSPNGDGKNDTWNSPGLEAYPLHTLTVFNRYGQVVFQRKKTFVPWNGFFKGQLLPAGAYTYLIDLNNGIPVLRGSFLLIK